MKNAQCQSRGVLLKASAKAYTAVLCKETAVRRNFFSCTLATLTLVISTHAAAGFFWDEAPAGFFWGEAPAGFFWDEAPAGFFWDEAPAGFFLTAKKS